ncbi:MAG: XTP/dITP diphosphatase [Eubacteriales bacterium]|nr:XTP/dITP diphosphatase [Eubacteriales bacterium]MDY3333197.1 XTP/dITP diphosphatase [Gallibacter sp.]
MYSKNREIKAVLASKNKHKIQEINDILKPFNINLVSMTEAGLGDMEIVEDGTTFEENSMIKAKAIVDKLGGIAIADDSGLEVDALGGAPGIYSARYAGDNTNDETNNEKLIRELKEIPAEKRTARYVCVITMLFEDGKSIVARGEVEGKITDIAQGDGGFGYDPHFIPEGFDKTFACFTPEEKNTVSHRARALQVLSEELKKYYKEIYSLG